MSFRSIVTALLAASITFAQDLTISGKATSGGEPVGDVPNTSGLTYLSYSTTLTRSQNSVTTLTGSAAFSTSSSNGTADSGSASSTAADSVTYLRGGTATSLNGTASSTSTSARPTNTQPCNNYPELCGRSYSNITMIAAHNYPFVRKGNAGSNQALGVVDQLNDGIRMLQGQTHWENDTLWYCHTSCDLLNIGKVQEQLETIADWVAAHPYDVITILLGNYDQVDVSHYVDPIQKSGLGRYVYEPPQVPMALDDWPTLGEMILTQKRVVIFMDYKANQTAVPYILDEFSQMWETPFSPTDATFPCPMQRPPGLNRNQTLDRLYLANHNLNTQVSLLGMNLLLPNTAEINQTNAVSGDGSLGAMADTCLGDWGRPPNFLLVDYYNYGNVPGSVFQVAATHNDVTYTQSCCGGSASAAGERLLRLTHIFATAAVILLALLL